MQDLVFFQADTGKSVLYPCKPTDTVNLLTLAEVFDLDVGEISFGGILIPQKDGYSDSLWSEIKGMMCGAGTKERPILVTSRARFAAENKTEVQRNVGREDGLTSQYLLTALEQISSKVNNISNLLRESVSHTRAASTMTRDDIRALRHCLGAVVAYEEPDCTVNALLGAKTEGGVPFGDDRHEIHHKEEYMQNFKRMINRGDVAWKDATRTEHRVRFTDAEFPVTAGNDLVLYLMAYQCDITLGAILGVEIKEKLSWSGIRQAETEFYVWSYMSQFPFIQLITDMEHGGVAIYSKGGSDVIFRAFGSMNALRDFITRVGEALPPNTGEVVDGNDNLITIEPLPEPSRKCFIPRNLRMDSTAMAQQEALMLAAYRNNSDDVANLRDLDCFAEATI